MWVRRLRKAAGMPRRELARRVAREIDAEIRAVVSPVAARRFDLERLLEALDADSLESLWTALAARPFAMWTQPIPPTDYERLCPGGTSRVNAAAARALRREVTLLGSQPTQLSTPIEWSVDFKSGLAWPSRSPRRLDLIDLERPSDVKTPWELSRLQWLVPAGQAYLLSGDERYAVSVREVLREWIVANPYGRGVNWAIAMEAALRVLSWSWFFHVFAESEAWSDAGFRRDFLTTLFLHGRFIESNLEWSEVRGNHYTADAAGLTFAGLFFGQGTEPTRWSDAGWDMLNGEIELQVHPDGVDFEASTAYHRLVCELFALPALYRRALALPVPEPYGRRLREMGRFVAAYSDPNGESPNWGDADDGRALPFSETSFHDHRYLIGVVGPEESFSGPRDELVWLLGPAAAEALPEREAAPARGSAAFPDGGFYVAATARDHVFIDCGDVGLAGLGGHGHNDCLSFRAVLDAVPLVVDSGTFTYTSSRTERNRYRGTAAHNTPQLDGLEQNRLSSPLDLWHLHFDAVPHVLRWEDAEGVTRFEGTHDGFARAASPVTPRRKIVLGKRDHALVIRDEFDGEGEHRVVVRLHLAPGLRVSDRRADSVRIGADHARFTLSWFDADAWRFGVQPTWISPSYGVRLQSFVLELSRDGTLRPLTVALIPGEGVSDVPAYVDELVRA